MPHQTRPSPANKSSTLRGSPKRAHTSRRSSTFCFRLRLSVFITTRLHHDVRAGLQSLESLLHFAKRIDRDSEQHSNYRGRRLDLQLFDLGRVIFQGLQFARGEELLEGSI